MGYHAILEAIRSWPIPEQLRLAHGIQDGLPPDESEFDLSIDEQTELDRRIAYMDANPDSGITFNEMLEKAKARHGR